MPLFADIVLPIACQPFTFEVPTHLDQTLSVGSVVRVPLGKRKQVGGVVVRLHVDAPACKTIKPVSSALFESPLIPECEIRFWQWMSEYYMCTQGEVVAAALPSLLRPEGFSDEQFADNTYAPRLTTFIRSVDGVQPNTRAKKQIEALALLRTAESKGVVAKHDLTASGVSPAVLQGLLKAGVVELYMAQCDPATVNEAMHLPTLSPAQQQAADQIRTRLSSTDTVLFRGVAGSGKSEVAASLAAQYISEGKSVLWLVPDISLSSQFARRMEAIFGSRVTIYHSGLSARRRSEIFVTTSHATDARLVVGLRSALFLPLRNLGLVVVDEEYDSAYKQQDTSPRYNGRDAAVTLASLHGAKTILCAATPSMESYANVLSGKYGVVRLDERYGTADAPVITLSDIRRSAKRGERKSGINKQLKDALSGVLSSGSQAIIFQNRRGTASYVECECGWKMRCPVCNITLTPHGRQSVCHYCGRRYPLVTVCPECGATPEPKGTGTESVVENLQGLFPEARIARLDRDTATSATRINAITNDFEAGRTDILVGTGMLARGFDFGGVSLVGVINADNLFTGVDFRSSERALDMLMQVAGRAGRRDLRGEVIIQTAQPQNPILGFVAAQDFDGAAAAILAERKAFGYPPYNRIIMLTVKSHDSETSARAAQYLASQLADCAVSVFGPQPTVEQFRDTFSNLVMLKIARTERLKAVKGQILDAIQRLYKTFKKVTVCIDVDPQ